MAKHIVKVDRKNRVFRVNIPRRIISEHRWGDVSYVLVEHQPPDQVVIRRLLDVKALEA